MPEGRAIDLRKPILAVGDLDVGEAERVTWDVIVVGTGMGGGTLGRRLAESGRRVLFVEKGRSTLPGVPGTIRAAMPELAEPRAYRSADTYYDSLARAGRFTDEVEDISRRFPRRFVPFIGSGTGVFPRQPAPGRLPHRPRTTPLSPADGLRLHRRM